jgi:hypothetical protein
MRYYCGDKGRRLMYQILKWVAIADRTHQQVGTVEVDQDVGDRAWWESHTRRLQQEIDESVSCPWCRSAEHAVACLKRAKNERIYEVV